MQPRLVNRGPPVAVPGRQCGKSGPALAFTTDIEKPPTRMKLVICSKTMHPARSPESDVCAGGRPIMSMSTSCIATRRGLSTAGLTLDPVPRAGRSLQSNCPAFAASLRRWSPAWASLPCWALPEAFRTHSTAAAFRTNRYLAATASFILRVLLAEVARDHAVRAFAVWTANTTCGPAALAACVFGIGFLIAEGAGYRTVWTCPAHRVLVAAW